MLGSAFVTTRLSSTTMKRAIETIAKGHPARGFIEVPPLCVVSVCLLTLEMKKRGSDLGRQQALRPHVIERQEVHRRGDRGQHSGGEEAAELFDVHSRFTCHELV